MDVPEAEEICVRFVEAVGGGGEGEGKAAGNEGAADGAGGAAGAAGAEARPDMAALGAALTRHFGISGAGDDDKTRAALESFGLSVGGARQEEAAEAPETIVSGRERERVERGSWGENERIHLCSVCVMVL